ncbi:MAG TPA: U32 family peptidase C-terminal domain-containing protein, partial [Clostridia bacterium]|nr:U32 family peptidase C-terminal domain-containing protein [Clostridia bacterium]
GEYFPVVEGERGTYLLSSRDLCLIEHIPELIGAGVASFKIEGRMKSINYVATVVSAYRRAIDGYYDNPSDYSFDPVLLEQLKRVSNRAYTTGFIFGRPSSDSQNYGGEIYRRPYTFIGLIKDYNKNTGMATVEQRNHFAVGETIEVFGPDGNSFEQKITEILNEDGESVAVAQHPQMQVRMPLNGPLEPFTLLRRKNV